MTEPPRPARPPRALHRFRGRRRGRQEHPGRPCSPEALRDAGRRVVVTRQPGGTPLGAPSRPGAARRRRVASGRGAAVRCRQGPARARAGPARPAAGRGRAYRPLHRLLHRLPRGRARPRTRRGPACARVGGRRDVPRPHRGAGRPRGRGPPATRRRCTIGSRPRRTPSTNGSVATSSTGPRPTRSAISSWTPRCLRSISRPGRRGAQDPWVARMSVWDDVVGQQHAVEALSRAASRPRLDDPRLAAHRPARLRALHSGSCLRCGAAVSASTGAEYAVTAARRWAPRTPTSRSVATQGLSIKVEDARALVQEAGLRPSVGAWRVIIIEDADRLTERAADALLKALEEPTPRTVWVLCAPSLEDVIITIRSRCRQVRLRTPPIDAVADLLERRDGIPPAMARYAARAAEAHVGLARRLARDESARNRRHEIISLPLKIRTVGDAVGAAADLAGIADEESAARAGERDAAERMRLVETLGADPAARTQPPHIRAQLAALERDQKARATRSARDVVDRSLVDLMSMYRDALLVRTGAAVELVNAEGLDQVRALASALVGGAAARRPGGHRRGARADQPQRRAASRLGGDGRLAADLGLGWGGPAGVRVLRPGTSGMVRALEGHEADGSGGAAAYGRGRSGGRGDGVAVLVPGPALRAARRLLDRAPAAAPSTAPRPRPPRRIIRGWRRTTARPCGGAAAQAGSAPS